jgi:DNA-directed RNA polymerase III subunit RPC8
MFVLTRVLDTLAVEPRFMHGGEMRTLRREIKRRFVNAVVPDVGLAVGLHDVEEVRKAIVYPGRGEAHMPVVFRLIVFRPFEGEVIDGFVCAADPTGITISLIFFDQIHVPADLMAPPDCSTPEYDRETNSWSTERSDGARLTYDLRLPCRFRIHKIVFNEESSEKPPMATDAVPVLSAASSAAAEDPDYADDDGDKDLEEDNPEDMKLLSQVEKRRGAPMECVGSFAEDGLGLVSWHSVVVDADAAHYSDGAGLLPEGEEYSGEYDEDEYLEDDDSPDELVDEDGAESSVSDD